MITRMNDFLKLAGINKKRKIAVAAAQDENVLQSVNEAYKAGLTDAILVGDKEEILRLSDKVGLDIDKFDIIKESDRIRAVRTAVDLVNSGDANVLMKGSVMTADLLRVVLGRESDLRTDRVLSHVAVFEMEHYHKLLILTDAGINIAPDIKQKAAILDNALMVASCLGIEKPKVAVLAAVEAVNPSMQATVDAAVLCKMAERSQLRNCLIDGPLALDIAISKASAEHKGIAGQVAGDADILLVPDIEAGNILHKALVFLCKARSCAVISGAKVPLVVTSRAEDYLAKLYSIALASIISNVSW